MKCYFKPYPSATGDTCHGDMLGFSNREAKSFFKKIPFSNFRICEDDMNDRPLIRNDLPLN